VGKRGAFIVIEGLDGSGKSTQAKMLAAALRKEYDVVCTVEPSRGAIGRFIRNRILFERFRPSASVEALLFAADRIDHVQREVAPALAEGRVVISDRYLYSSLAYQGSAGLSLDWIQTINVHSLKPDLALFIDVSPEVVLGRLRRKKSVMETLEIQQKVRSIYLRYVEKGELAKIEGGNSKKTVAREVLAVVCAFLKTRC
jgi:dTMP kinase